MANQLRVQALKCSHDQSVLFDHIDLSLEEGELCALLGPSGSGKTTLLRAIAGLHPAAAGNIRLHGKDITALPAEKRGIGMVFQDHALFPHLSVAANVGFGLRNKKTRAERIQAMLTLVGLDGFDKRYPYQLSGGQQQRVALARALAPKPRLLLLDEPFSSLDSELRQSLCLRVRDILKQARVTAIMVTHDQAEAFAFADNIGLICDARLQQFGSAHNLYYHPLNRTVAQFIGHSQFIAANIDNRGKLTCAGDLINLTVNKPEGAVWLLSRPENWHLVKQAEDSGNGSPATVIKKVFFGAETHYQLHIEALQEPLMVSAYADDYAVDEMVLLRPNFKHITCFPKHNI